MRRELAWLGWALAAPAASAFPSPAAANVLPGQPVPGLCRARPARRYDRFDAPRARGPLSLRRRADALGPGDYWIRSAALPVGIGAGEALDPRFARIGGEEFATVADAARAVAAAQVLDTVRAERMPLAVAVTASVESCAGPLAHEADWKALYRRADQALFAAKAAGRDRARDAGTIAAAA